MEQNESQSVDTAQWETYKDAIHLCYMQKNHTLKELREHMKLVYNFHATDKAYRYRLKIWGFHKNKSINHQVIEATETESRRRAAQALPKDKFHAECQWLVFRSSANTLRWLDQNDEGKMQLLHSVDTLIKSLFGAGKRGWTAEEFGFVFPRENLQTRVDQSRQWEIVGDQCRAAASLARTGHYGRVRISLEHLFLDVDQLSAQFDPSSLIGFWKTCMDLLDIRLRQQRQRATYFQTPDSAPNDTTLQYFHPLLNSLLERLKTSLSSHLGPQHSFVVLVNTLSVLILNQPREVKAIMEIGYRKLIEQLQDTIGRGHVSISDLWSHYCKYWSKNVDMQANFLALNCIPLLMRAGITYDVGAEQTVSILHSYTEIVLTKSGDPLSYVPVMPRGGGPVDRLENLAKELRDRSIENSSKFTGLALRSSRRALIFSTDVLAKIYFKHDFDFSCNVLEQAIEILRNGDTNCRIWASSFSNRLSLWYKQHNRKKAFETELKKEKKRTKAIRSTLEGVSQHAVLSEEDLAGLTKSGRTRRRVRGRDDVFFKVLYAGKL